GGGFFFPGKRAELFHQRGEFAVRSDPGALGLFEGGEVGSAFKLRERGLFQRFDFVQERHNSAVEEVKKDSAYLTAKTMVFCGLLLPPFWGKVTETAIL